MDKNHWFPVFIGTKSDVIKVVCNGDGWSVLEKVGFVKSERELPDEIAPKKVEPKGKTKGAE